MIYMTTYRTDRNNLEYSPSEETAFTDLDDVVALMGSDYVYRRGHHMMYRAGDLNTCFGTVRLGA